LCWPAPLGRRGRAGHLRREGVVDLPVRRGDRRARVCGCRGRGRAAPRREAHAVVVRNRGLGTLVPDAARPRRRPEGPAIRPGRRRGNRLRAAGDDGRAAPRRRGGGRRPAGARPAPAVAVLPPGDGAPRPLREPGGDRPRAAHLGPPRAEGAPGRGWRPGGSRWRATGGNQPGASCRASPRFFGPEKPRARNAGPRLSSLERKSSAVFAAVALALAVLTAVALALAVLTAVAPVLA